MGRPQDRIVVHKLNLCKRHKKIERTVIVIIIMNSLVMRHSIINSTSSTMI